MLYNLVVDSFHTQKLCTVADFLQELSQLIVEILDTLRFWATLWRA